MIEYGAGIYNSHELQNTKDIKTLAKKFVGGLLVEQEEKY